MVYATIDRYRFFNTSSGTLVPRNAFKALYGFSLLSTAFFITSYALNASIIGESEQPVHCIATYSATLFKCSCSIFQYYANNSIPKVYYLIVAGSGFAPQAYAYSFIPALPYILYIKKKRTPYKTIRKVPKRVLFGYYSSNLCLGSSKISSLSKMIGSTSTSRRNT